MYIRECAGRGREEDVAAEAEGKNVSTECKTPRKNVVLAQMMIQHCMYITINIC